MNKNKFKYVRKQGERFFKMSDLEMEILEWISAHTTSEMIAQELELSGAFKYVSPEEVDRIVANMKKHLGAKSRKEMAQLYSTTPVDLWKENIVVWRDPDDKSHSEEISYKTAEIELKGSEVIVEPPLEYDTHSWTGNPGPEDLKREITKAIPILTSGFDDLIAAVEQERHNVPEVDVALNAARDLHHALGELIRMAESQNSLSALGEKWTGLKASGLKILEDHAVFMATSPVITMGIAAILEQLSGNRFGTQETATIWAGWAARSYLKKS